MSAPTTDFSLRSIAVAAFGPSVLFGLAEGAMLPVIPLTAVDRGASVALASLVVSLIGVGSILSNIPAGILTTRVGERWALVVAAATSIVGLALCLLDVGLWVFALGVLLVGAASSVFNLARQSFLTDAVPIHLRARAMSTLGGSMRIGVFVGPFLGAAVIHGVGLQGGYWVAIAATLAAGFVAFQVPDLVAGETGTGRSAASTVATMTLVREHWRTFVTLGSGILLLSAVRASRQVVIPLWATHIGLAPSTASIVYGLAGAIDMLVFYPAGKVMDRRGRQWVAVPSMVIMGTAFVLMPLTHTVAPFIVVSMALGFGNGIGSGLIMTLGADASPVVGRPKFLGLWRELSDAGSGIGPVLLSAVTALAGLAAGVIVAGGVAYAAAASLWRWIPRRQAPPRGPASRPPDGAASRARPSSREHP
jgi:MFS family permease